MSDRHLETLPLWPADAPDSSDSEIADLPTLTFIRPAASVATGAAIVVCPGGGYEGLAPHEGDPVAEWLATLGITAAVLRYRLGPRFRHPAMLRDAQRAIRMVRSRAAQLDLAKDRVGILGFSAGGHLASTAATHFDTGDPGSGDPVERESSRPDLAVLVYPVITMADPHTHEGSRRNLLGPEPPMELVQHLYSERQVTPETPPIFFVHTADDEAVPVENSLRMASALRAAGVPFELHVFASGPHGFGLGADDPVLGQWPSLCARWLRRWQFA